MKITINGELREFNEELTIARMLVALSLVPAKVAVERNLQIVPRSAFGETVLSENDKIEIVRFIGGG